jgi:hypothetical protein
MIKTPYFIIFYFYLLTLPIRYHHPNDPESFCQTVRPSPPCITQGIGFLSFGLLPLQTSRKQWHGYIQPLVGG